MRNNVKHLVLSVFNTKLLETLDSEGEYKSTLTITDTGLKLELQDQKYELRKLPSYDVIKVMHQDYVVGFKINPRCTTSDIEWLFSEQCQEIVNKLIEAKVQVNSKLNVIDRDKDSLEYWNYTEGEIGLEFVLGDMSIHKLPFSLTIVDTNYRHYTEMEGMLINDTVSIITDFLIHCFNLEDAVKCDTQSDSPKAEEN